MDPGGLLGIGSGWAIVAWGVIQLFRGQIVPRRTYLDKAAECDYLRGALSTESESRREAQRQVGELTELARTSTHALTALPRGEVTDRGLDRQAAAPPPG
ncbi:hypothetical protein [Actinacidiphila alni]|uniref:hypothetical protein n=1 Tax=Actinacidiphila alni TaxID=380248 RepID=UPI003454EA18